MIPIILIAVLMGNTPQIPLSVATTDDALATLANPAGLGSNRNFNFYYFYNFTKENFWDNQTFLAQTGPFGISYVDLKDYRISLGSKITDNLLFGTTYRKYLKKTAWDAGIIFRPFKVVSLGAVMHSVGQKITNQYLVGFGIRPLSNRYTFTCDAYTDNWKKPFIGIEIEPFNGIEIKGKINTDGDFNIHTGINLGKLGFGSMHNSSTKKWAGYLRLGTERRRTFVPMPPKFLEMKLSGVVADQKPGFSLFGTQVARTTYEILSIIEKAKKDKEINGIVLKLDNPQMSFALAQEIKSALNDFKKENKKLIVFAPQLGNVDYYLACTADEIISHPLGHISIPGIAAKAILLKGALDKLGIEAEYEQVGKYKSAPEMLTADTLSSANREVINSMVDDYFEQVTNTIALERNLTQQEIRDKINYGLYTAKQAKENNLIDEYYYEDELDSIFKSQYKAFQKITAKKYNAQKDYVYDWLNLPNIVVIYARGSIMTGESGTDPLTGGVTCGANTIVKAIRTARKNKNVKAIILRVDSPGGDGFASDLIWREIFITKKTKPIIVSMGPVAASGGYYISMSADKIFAMPATITGSIGGFGLKFVTQGLYSKLGIKTETIKRGEHADAFSSDRKFTVEEREMLRKQIEDFYTQFINKVAESRNLTPEYVDSVGQGRVWTGNQAKDRMLVDSLGGLLEAIDFAKEKANVKEVKLEFMPKSRRGFINLFVSLIKNYEWHHE